MRVVEAAEQTRCSEPLLSLWLLSSLVPELRSELKNIAAGPAGQQREHVTKIGPGLDGVKLTAGDQTGRNGIPLGAFVAAAEGPVVALMMRWS
jgi:hypothetical protein